MAVLGTIDEATQPLTRAGAAPLVPSGRPGTVVGGRYELQNLLGAGGMGAVWRAHDRVADRPVALKELAPGQAAQARAEAGAAGRVRHPGVMRVLGTVVGDAATPGIPWIVMSLVPGGTLARRVRHQGRLAPPAAGDVARRLLAAVTAVHAAGLVHRDITPGNVIRSDDGEVVLVDFGLAGPARAADRSARFHGSPPYVAPETVLDGRAGPAADLFAVGATLFTAVEGRRPFDAPTPAATMAAIVSAPVPPLRHAGALGPLIDGLLRKDPAERLTAAQAWALVG